MHKNICDYNNIQTNNRINIYFGNFPIDEEHINLWDYKPIFNHKHVMFLDLK